jgi:hypothetical protein
MGTRTNVMLTDDFNNEATLFNLIPMASDTFKSYVTYNSLASIQSFQFNTHLSVTSSKLTLELLDDLEVYNTIIIFLITLINTFYFKIDNLNLIK